MAKQGGLGDNLWIGAANISNDVKSVEVSSPQETIDVTGIDKYAIERIGGVRDGNMQFVAHWNPTGAHLTLGALPTVDALVTYARGTALGSPAACLIAKQIGYDGTRSDKGEYTLKIEAQANGYGCEWGEQLTAGLRTDTAATNGVGVDNGASTAHGGQAYLHVTGLTGTDVLMTVRHSTDNVTYATLGTFASVTTPGWQRIAIAPGTTVNRYVRVITSTTGGFTSCTFACVFSRNEVAVTF